MATVLNRTALRPAGRLTRLVGVGGIGTGIFFQLEGAHPLGTDESRPARLLDVRDYCKLHIISHYVGVLLGADPAGRRFHLLPIGKVGADDAGRRMCAEMAQAGMDTSRIELLPDHPTMFSVCFQYPDGSGGNITASNSAGALLQPGDLDASLFSPQTVVLSAPEVPLETRARLLELAGEAGAFRAASFVSAEIGEAQRRGMLAGLDLLAVNVDEAGALAGQPFDTARPELVLEACARQLPGTRLVVSAGRCGAWACENGTWAHCPAPALTPVSTAGAGDALLGAVLSSLVAGLPFLPGAPGRVASALQLGVLLGAYTVTSPHTIHPDARMDTLLEFAAGLGLDCSPLESFLEMR